MLKALSSFFFLLLLLSPLVSFAAEQETLPPGTLTIQEYTEFLQATAATDSYSLYNEKMGDAPPSLLVLFVRESLALTATKPFRNTLMILCHMSLVFQRSVIAIGFKMANPRENKMKQQPNAEPTS